MIFVTVGTHEQSFRRLIEKIDNLIEDDIITEDVVIQTGYTKDYKVKNARAKDFFDVEEMESLCKEADIIITHGGPGSILMPFRLNKIPIMVPRNPEFNEHVDNHQVLFTRKLVESKKVIGIFEIDDIEDTIINYEKYSSECTIESYKTRNIFVEKFEREVEELIKK